MWAPEFDAIFQWAVPLFFFFVMFVVVLTVPCCFHALIAYRMHRYYVMRGNLPFSPNPPASSLRAEMRVMSPHFNYRRSSEDRERVPDVSKLDLEASVAASEEDGVCTICYAHHINCRLKPCRHAFCCLGCAQFFIGRPCGLCRVEVASIRKLKSHRKLRAEAGDGNAASEPEEKQTKKSMRKGRKEKKVLEGKETPSVSLSESADGDAGPSSDGPVPTPTV